MFVVLGIPWNIRGTTFNNPLRSKSLLILLDFQIHWIHQKSNLIYLVRRIITSLLDVHLCIVPFLNFCIMDITALNNLTDKSWMRFSLPFILFLPTRIAIFRFLLLVAFLLSLCGCKQQTWSALSSNAAILN